MASSSLLVRDIIFSWNPRTIGFISSSFVDDDENVNVFDCSKGGFTIQRPLVNANLQFQFHKHTSTITTANSQSEHICDELVQVFAQCNVHEMDNGKVGCSDFFLKNTKVANMLDELYLASVVTSADEKTTVDYVLTDSDSFGLDAIATPIDDEKGAIFIRFHWILDLSEMKSLRNLLISNFSIPLVRVRTVFTNFAMYLCIFKGPDRDLAMPSCQPVFSEYAYDMNNKFLIKKYQQHKSKKKKEELKKKKKNRLDHLRQACAAYKPMFRLDVDCLPEEGECGKSPVYQPPLHDVDNYDYVGSAGDSPVYTMY